MKTRTNASWSVFLNKNFLWFRLLTKTWVISLDLKNVQKLMRMPHWLLYIVKRKMILSRVCVEKIKIKKIAALLPVSDNYYFYIVAIKYGHRWQWLDLTEYDFDNFQPGQPDPHDRDEAFYLVMWKNWEKRAGFKREPRNLINSHGLAANFFCF